MGLLPLSDDALTRREQYAEAARMVRELRATPETTLEDLDLTVRTYNRLCQIGAKTVADILAGEVNLAAIDHIPLEEFEVVMAEVRNRLVAGGIDENLFPQWLSLSGWVYAVCVQSSSEDWTFSPL